MNIIALVVAVLWVDLIVIFISLYGVFGKTIREWYAKFGPVAVLSDCLIIILGIMLASLIYPTASTLELILLALTVQLVHDLLFYVLVIEKLPEGQNSIIDLFKKYAHEGGYYILIADAIMVTSSILGHDILETQSIEVTSFLGFLATYAISYMIYTK
jgi:VanZ family protein